MDAKTRKLTVVGVSLTAALVSLAPPLRAILYPILLLNTHVHELCHALSAYMTGGYAETIRVEADVSGVTLLATRAPLVTASAGYIGASIVGAIIIAMSRSERGARIALLTLATFLGLSLLLWVRGSSMGVFVGIAWAAILFAVGLRARGATLITVAQLVGAFQCFSSISSVLDITKLSAYARDAGDASAVAGYTGIPALAVALVWMALSAMLAFFSLRYVFLADGQTAPPAS